MILNAVVEGDTDIPVVRALAESAGLELALTLDMGGKGQLDKRLNSFASAAQGSPWLVLRDLDDDAPCAPSLLDKLGVRPTRWFALRLAVREMEAWLMADAEALSRFLRVEISQIPTRPDELPDPTRALVDLARRSRRVAIRKAMVPPRGASTPVGQLYEATIIEFASQHWSLERACRRSPSLRGAYEALVRLGRSWKQHLRGS